MNRFILVALGCAVASGAFSQSKFFQASLTPEIALKTRDTLIEGIALNIWGENPQSALAFGIVNGSTGESVGLSLGILNYTENYKGVQWALVNTAGGTFMGWQAGLVNYADTMAGFQYGGVNIATTMKGLQLGWVNITKDLTGVQLGYVNYAQTAYAGIQIGLVNIIPENQWFSEFPDELAKGMVIVNWRFE